MLVDMGITDFKIDKYGEDGLYRIIRGDDDTPVFKTLSEGERTIISILYFLEACQGVLNKELSPKNVLLLLMILFLVCLICIYLILVEF